MMIVKILSNSTNATILGISLYGLVTALKGYTLEVMMFKCHWRMCQMKIAMTKPIPNPFLKLKKKKKSIKVVKLRTQSLNSKS